MMTEQSAKADARRSAEQAPKADPEIAARALNDAKENRRPMPAQKRTANALPETKGVVAHHPKDKIVSEFDDPASNKIE